ncbi:MAG: GGDEF domain-containing protein, partial [Actinomycetota bacterium]
CHPVLVGSVRAGVLEASSTTVAAFDRDDSKLIRALAGLISAAFRTASHVKSGWRQDTDPVTGLPNPTAYRHRLGFEVERSRRTGEPLGLAIVQLLGYYDSTALAIVAGALGGLRKIDEAFLVDGGTFAVIMPNTPLEGAMIATRKISTALAEPLAEFGVLVRVGAAQQAGLDAGELHDAGLDAAGSAITL